MRAARTSRTTPPSSASPSSERRLPRSPHRSCASRPRSDALQGKLSLWRALREVRDDHPELAAMDLDALIEPLNRTRKLRRWSAPRPPQSRSSASSCCLRRRPSSRGTRESGSSRAMSRSPTTASRSACAGAATRRSSRSSRARVMSGSRRSCRSTSAGSRRSGRSPRVAGSPRRGISCRSATSPRRSTSTTTRSRAWSPRRSSSHRREDSARFVAPEWLGREVTGDARYANQSLARSGRPPE